MGLDVGVVQIDYQHRPPRGPAYEFARYLIHNSDDADWGFSEGTNVMVEYSLGDMLNHVDEYVESEGLDFNNRIRVLNWVYGLPWDDETIMLHLGW